MTDVRADFLKKYKITNYKREKINRDVLKSYIRWDSDIEKATITGVENIFNTYKQQGTLEYIKNAYK